MQHTKKEMREGKEKNLKTKMKTTKGMEAKRKEKEKEKQR